MTRSKPEARRGPKQVSGVYSVTLYNEELNLVEGIVRALKKQGVPVTRNNGQTNKLMVIKEAIRQAAEKLGRETADKSLVKLAVQFKMAFQTLKARGRPGGPGYTRYASARAPVSRKGK